MVVPGTLCNGWFLQLTPSCSYFVLFHPGLVGSLFLPYVDLATAAWYLACDIGLPLEGILIFNSHQLSMKCECWLKYSPDVVSSSCLSHILTHPYCRRNECPLLWAIQLGLPQYWAHWLPLQTCLGYLFPSRTPLRWSSSVIMFTSWVTVHTLWMQQETIPSFMYWGW